MATYCENVQSTFFFLFFLVKSVLISKIVMFLLKDSTCVFLGHHLQSLFQQVTVQPSAPARRAENGKPPLRPLEGVTLDNR